MKGARLLLAAAAASLLGATPAPPAFERLIEGTRPGKVVVTLDRDVYEGARADLGDLRVLDDTGAQVPYLLEESREEPGPSFKQPRILNRGFVPARSATATLDFGDPILKSELVLSLTGENFRRRVVVEGRNKHERWTTLTDSAYVFAVPPPSAARYETVRLPENNYQYLRVTLHNGPDDPGRIEILDAWVRPQGQRRPRELPLSLRFARAEVQDLRETHVTVDLGARHQPFRGLVLDVEEPRFFRGVAVEARREVPVPGPGATPPPVSWLPLVEGTLYRYDEGDERNEKLRLDVVGRQRVLRTRIRNRDDRPLEIRGVTAMVPVERLVFAAEPGRRYRLTYGVAGLEPPAYDVQRTVGDPAIWIAQATEAALQPPVRIVSPPPLPPWTERHPALLWGGLLAVVLLLGSVTWRALKVS